MGGVAGWKVEIGASGRVEPAANLAVHANLLSPRPILGLTVGIARRLVNTGALPHVGPDLEDDNSEHEDQRPEEDHFCGRQLTARAVMPLLGGEELIRF